MSHTTKGRMSERYVNTDTMSEKIAVPTFVELGSLGRLQDHEE